MARKLPTNDYFVENKERIKIFTKWDTNSNGMLDIDEVYAGLKIHLKIDDLSMIKDAIDISFTKTSKYFKSEHIMDTEQLKVFFKFLKVFFEMWNVFRQLNESKELDFRLDIKEFQKATAHHWFKKNKLDINDDNYMEVFYKICGSDEYISFLEFAE